MRQYSRIDKEVEEARGRIGHTSQHAMEWVLKRLVGRDVDLEAMLPSERGQIQREVVAFLIYRWGDIGTPRKGLLLEVWPSEKFHQVQHRQVYPRFPPKETLLEIQNKVRNLFEQFVRGECVPFAYGKGAVHFLRLEDGRPMLRFESEVVPTFLLKCALLLLSMDGRLAQCGHDECRVIFPFKRRRRSRYCDGCNNRLRQQRFNIRQKKRSQGAAGERMHTDKRKVL
jgi:hypothetical protein